MSPSEIVNAVTTAVVVPVVGWIVRLESKQAQLETKISADKELFEAKIDAQTDILKRIELGLDNRLTRIEKSLNGHLRGE